MHTYIHTYIHVNMSKGTAREHPVVYGNICTCTVVRVTANSLAQSPCVRKDSCVIASACRSTLSNCTGFEYLIYNHTPNKGKIVHNTCIHACMHACIHTYIHVYVYVSPPLCLSLSRCIFLHESIDRSMGK